MKTRIKSLDLGFSEDPIIPERGVQGGTAEFSFGSAIAGEGLIKGKVFNESNGGCIGRIFDENFVISKRECGGVFDFGGELHSANPNVFFHVPIYKGIFFVFVGVRDQWRRRGFLLLGSLHSAFPSGWERVDRGK